METVGLIPCAGKGSRLGLAFSKEMYPDVHNDHYRPIIMYTIDAFKQAGIKHLVFTINPLKTDLLKFLGNGSQFGMNFTFCIHPEPKSLPESLNEAFHIIKDKRVVFVMPDTVIEPKDFITRMLEYHTLQTSCDVTLGCFRTDNPSKFAMVGFDGEKLTHLEEKQKQSKLQWMWGTMIWESAFTFALNKFIVDYCNKVHEKELYLSNAFENLIQEKRVNICRFEKGIYRDLGTYDEINDWSKSKIGDNKLDVAIDIL